MRSPGTFLNCWYTLAQTFSLHEVTEMPATKPDWTANKDLPVGRGATFQQWVATVGKDKLEMDVAPWGEGHLRVNGLEIGFVDDAKDRRQAFRDLNQVAERYLQGQISCGEEPSSWTARKASSSGLPTRTLLHGDVPRPFEHSGRTSPLPISTTRPRNTSSRSPRRSTRRS